MKKDTATRSQKLTLHRETLRQLESGELKDVQGGNLGNIDNTGTTSRLC